MEIKSSYNILRNVTQGSKNERQIECGDKRKKVKANQIAVLLKVI